MASLEPVLTDCEECNIDDCKALQRILGLLTQYQQWLYGGHHDSISSVINEVYSTQRILTDYKHIKQKRYTIDNCPQSLTECIPNDRHRRDNYDNYQKLYFRKEIKEILIQKLLDQIHLFIYHPSSNNHSRNYNSSNPRFVTNKQHILKGQIELKNKDTEVEEKKYVEPISMDTKEIDKDAYNFGQQFFYWEYYKIHPWFISKKYDNLQDELLNNELCAIEKIVWDMEYENAMDKFEYDHRLKSLRSIGEFSDKYGIEDGKAIDTDHLLSLLFYCNTDQLQSIYSSTYRRNGGESDDIFKQKHRNFYHFGKLLRETVECFGDVLVDDGLVLYHGIDHPLYFEKMIAKFYAPTSTTKEITIAVQFAGNNGMILQIGKYERNAFYFDCWLSGYDQEREYLFIGGYAAIQIRNVLQFNPDNNEILNYSKHLSLIQCFLSLISNKLIDQQEIDSLPQNNEILPSLIQQGSRSDLPEYITTLYQYRCSKKNAIVIDLAEFCRISYILNINELLMENTQSMINMNALTKLFPNSKKITICLPITFKFTDKIIQYLYQNLSESRIRSHGITTIEIHFGISSIPLKIREQFASELQDDFDNIGWAISIENNEEDNESIYFTKINASNNPNYRPISQALRRPNYTETYINEEGIILNQTRLSITLQKSSNHQPEMEPDPIIFNDILHYTRSLYSAKSLTSAYSFLGLENYAIDLRRPQNILILIIHLISQLNYATQVWFIIVGDAPFRWIVWAFFCLFHLLLLAGLGGAVYKAWNEELLETLSKKTIAGLFCCSGILLLPITPTIVGIALPIIRTKRIKERGEEWLTQLLAVWCILPGVMFLTTTLPQITVLIAMINFYPSQYTLDHSDPNQDVLIWSFGSCFLMIIAVSIMISSIFEKTSVFIMNIIWTIFDYVSFFFIFAAAWYDDVGLGIAITDAVLFYLVFVTATVGYMYLYTIPGDAPVWQMVTMICCTVCCGAICYGIPFILGGPFTMITISFAAQFMYPDMMPVNLIFDTGLKYRIKKWISSASGDRELNFRLNCTNMVILDQYHAEPASNFYSIKAAMQSNLKDRNDMKLDVTRIIRQAKHPRESPDNDDLYAILMQRIMGLYIINRIMHFLFPLIYIIYIMAKDNDPMDNTNVLLIYMGYVLIILYPLCILSVIPVWISCNLYRLILPVYITDSNQFRNTAAYIANLHSSMRMYQLLEDIFGTRDIIYLILEYATAEFSSLHDLYKLERDERGERRRRPKQKRVMILGAENSGKSVIFKQARHIYGEIWTDQELNRFKEDIQLQLFDQIREAIYFLERVADNDFADELYLEQLKTINDLSDDAEAAVNIVDSFDIRQAIRQIVEEIKALWNDPVIKDIYQDYMKRGLAVMHQSSGVFLDNIDTIIDDNYVPTHDDILGAYCFYSRTPAGGRETNISVTDKFNKYKEDKFLLCDTCGWRNHLRAHEIERHKESMATLFVVSLSSYNEVTYNNRDTNLLDASIEYFEQVVNSDGAQSTPIFLLLNKSDLFRDKIKTIPITVCPALSGYNGDVTDYDECVEYIQRVFDWKALDAVVYTRVICALDQGEIMELFNEVQKQIIQLRLEAVDGLL